MHRRLALHAEVFLRFHDAVPEIHLPEPIDRHARREWMRRIDEPLREGEPCSRGASSGSAGSTGRHARLDLLGLVAVVATREHERLARRRKLAHDHRRRNRAFERPASRPEAVSARGTGRAATRGRRGSGNTRAPRPSRLASVSRARRTQSPARRRERQASESRRRLMHGCTAASHRSARCTACRGTCCRPERRARRGRPAERVAHRRR